MAQLSICVALGFVAVIWFEIAKLVKRVKSNADSNGSSQHRLKKMAVEGRT